MSDELSLPVPIEETVNQREIRVACGLELHDLARIARQMALGIKDPLVVLDDEGISPTMWDVIQALPIYRSLHEHMVKEHQGLVRANQRLAAQAAAGLEDTLPKLIVRLQSEGEDLKKVVDGVNVLAKIAGVADYRDGNNGGQKFQFIMNFGDGQRKTIDVTPAKNSAPETVRAEPQGQSDS